MFSDFLKSSGCDREKIWLRDENLEFWVFCVCSLNSISAHQEFIQNVHSELISISDFIFITFFYLSSFIFFFLTINTFLMNFFHHFNEWKRRNELCATERRYILKDVITARKFAFSFFSPVNKFFFCFLINVYKHLISLLFAIIIWQQFSPDCINIFFYSW